MKGAGGQRSAYAQYRDLARQLRRTSSSGVLLEQADGMPAER
ncbi:hypothetical protein [Streptomyces sp. H51]|nr:hypothetical protein [Streptomyces sp. H51]